MKNTWLIQRLRKPIQVDPTRTDAMAILQRENPFTFGGGLRRGGLSAEAYKLLGQCFEFDYMGAAEFEFGAVPLAIGEIAKSKLVMREITLAGTKVVKTKKGRSKYSSPEITKVEPTTYTCYVLAPEGLIDYALDLIPKVAQNQIELKSGAGLKRILDKRVGDSDYPDRTAGWLELDNGFFFFIDKEMADKTQALFT